MQIDDLCNRNVVYVLARDSVADAARLMRERHVGSVVVLENEAGRQPVGMFTDRDVAIGVVALALDAETTLVASAMRPGITRVRANEQVERALESSDLAMMVSRGMRREAVERKAIV